MIQANALGKTPIMIRLLRIVSCNVCQQQHDFSLINNSSRMGWG